MAGSIPAANGRDVLLKIFGRDKIPPAANAGLVFERYFPCWDASGRRRLAGTELRTALDEFVTEYNRRKNSAGEDLLSAGHARLRNAAGINGTRLRATARLAVGLGAEHPLENSLTFDRTSGAPVIPATSMKGLCRVSATLDSVESARLFTLFGSEDAQRDASGPRAVGDLIFFDALPETWPALVVDVMTPHHGRYYRDPNDVPPGDWESPVPVYFLAVEAGAVFVFRIISRSHDDQSMADAERWLAQGLHDLGIGGKTAVGYGTFEPLHPSPAAGR